MNRAGHTRAAEPAICVMRHPRSPWACFASAPDRGSSGAAPSTDVWAASQPPRSSTSAARTVDATSSACRPIRLISVHRRIQTDPQLPGVAGRQRRVVLGHPSAVLWRSGGQRDAKPSGGTSRSPTRPGLCGAARCDPCAHRLRRTMENTTAAPHRFRA